MVEAMSCGTPVITSNVSSMPEVTGDAGILVDPHSIVEIASAMEKINTNESLRAELAEKSLVQAKNFSWEKTAELLWNSIKKTTDA